jgi:hypothetical protein
MAVSMLIGGTTRTAVQLPYLLTSVAAVLMIAAAINVWLGRPHGWYVALLLTISTAFAKQLLTPAVEALELFLLASAFLTAVVWHERRTWFLALVSGLLLGLAFQVRETAGIGAVAVGIFVILRRPNWSAIAWAGLGFGIPLAIEFILYSYWTGDPLYRRRLSLGHTRIPSTELATKTSNTSLLNLQNVSAWRLEPGIRIHWLIDPFINAMANVQTGLVFAFAPLILLTQRARLDSRTRRLAGILMLGGLAYASVLVFVYAIDPKPRMLFVPQLFFTTAFVLMAVQIWRRDGRALVSAIAATIALSNLVLLYALGQPMAIVEATKRWNAEYPGQLYINKYDRPLFILYPELYNLPADDRTKHYFIFNSPSIPCDVLHSYVQSSGDLRIVDRQRISRVSVKGIYAFELCLFHSRRPVTARHIETIRNAYLLEQKRRART